MWTWIMSRNGKQIAIYAVIAIALFVAVRIYGSRQWQKGEAQGRHHVADQLVKEKEKEWSERERDIAEREAQAARQLDTLTQASNAVHAARAALIKNFEVTLKDMEAERVESYRYAGGVADADLIAELRAVSGALAAAGQSDPGGTAPDTRAAP